MVLCGRVWVHVAMEELWVDCVCNRTVNSIGKVQGGPGTWSDGGTVGGPCM